jgi:ProQ/FINO family
MTDQPARARPILRLGRPPPPKVAAVSAPSAPEPAPPTPPPPAKPMSKYAAKLEAVRAAKAALEAAPALVEAQRVAWRMEDLAHLRERFGALFDPEHPLPLALGIHKQVGKVIGLKRAKRLMEWWVRWGLYIQAVAASGVRYNLDGSVAGPVTEAQQAHARAILDATEQESPEKSARKEAAW